MKASDAIWTRVQHARDFVEALGFDDRADTVVYVRALEFAWHDAVAAEAAARRPAAPVTFAPDADLDVNPVDGSGCGAVGPNGPFDLSDPEERAEHEAARASFAAQEGHFGLAAEPSAEEAWEAHQAAVWLTDVGQGVGGVGTAVSTSAVAVDTPGDALSTEEDLAAACSPAPAPPPEAADVAADAPAPVESPAVAEDTDRAHRERRKVLFRTLWPDLRLSPDDVMRRLNDLPGPARHLTTTSALYALAKELGLPTARSIAYAAPATAPTDDDAQADEDRREAEVMFAAGKSARDVAEEFGRPLSQTSDWKVAWNDRRAAQGARA